MALQDEVRALSHWYGKKARKLPWRESRDPYAIWISEVMLQQTQVATVIPYYHRFLDRFPTLKALAEADEQTVLTLWSGLGYYSRAKNLHKGARYLVERGTFPKTREEILEVPGIGPYTAGAILSISFNLPVPLVDGNVQRVFARYFGLRVNPKAKKAQLFFWEKATRWVEASDAPRILNQALMELGATVCTKGVPKCDRCPLSLHCIAQKRGWQLELPLKTQRPKMKQLHWIGLVLQNSDQVLLQQNPQGKWWAGLWDFPRWEESSAPVPIQIRKRLFQTYRRAKRIVALNGVRHTVTHHRLHVTPYSVHLPKGTPAPKGTEWVSLSAVSALPLSSLAKKIWVQLEMPN